MEGQLKWFHLTFQQVGSGICLPVIVVGQLLSKKYGFLSALGAIFLGNGLLLLIGIAMTLMGAASAKNTAEHAAAYFGKQGGRFFALLMVLCMLGWFSIQLNLMTESYLYIAILGILSIWFVAGGLERLSWLSGMLIPFLLVAFCYSIYKAPQPELEGGLSFQGISLVMAVSIGAIIDLPNFFRHARSQKDGLIATSIVYALAIPLIETAGAYMGTSELPFILLVGGWLVNNGNLYSSAVSLETLFPSLKGKKGVLLLGCLGITLTYLNPVAYLEDGVNQMGLLLGSMGGCLFSGFVTKDRENGVWYFFCWAMGCLLGIFSGVLGAFLGAFFFVGLKQIYLQKEKVWNKLQAMF